MQTLHAFVIFSHFKITPCSKQINRKWNIPGSTTIAQFVLSVAGAVVEIARLPWIGTEGAEYIWAHIATVCLTKCRDKLWPISFPKSIPDPFWDTERFCCIFSLRSMEGSSKFQQSGAWKYWYLYNYKT